MRLASAYIGIEPFAKIIPSSLPAKGFLPKQKKFVEMDNPQIIREYNCHLGGVNLMGSLMGLTADLGADFEVK